MQDPNIQIAIFFGKGRFSNGVLIQPTTSFDLSDEQVNEFRDKIWPTIARMNDYAPTHSRLLKHVSRIIACCDSNLHNTSHR